MAAPKILSTSKRFRVECPPRTLNGVQIEFGSYGDPASFPADAVFRSYPCTLTVFVNVKPVNGLPDLENMLANKDGSDMYTLVIPDVRGLDLPPMEEITKSYVMPVPNTHIGTVVKGSPRGLVVTNPFLCVRGKRDVVRDAVVAVIEAGAELRLKAEAEARGERLSVQEGLALCLNFNMRVSSVVGSAVDAVLSIADREAV